MCAIAACRAAAPGPVDTVAAYADALRDQRYTDAWQMLSHTARQTLSYERFERLARERPEELRDALTAYERVDTQAPVIARLELSSGETVVLHYEGGEWRIDPSALEFYGQSTPRQALLSFARAVERERWDVLLSLAPHAVATQLREGGPPTDGGAAATPEHRLRDAWSGPSADSDRQVLGLLVQSLERQRPIEVSGGRATFTYGTVNQYTARLVREDGLWKVEDID
jgi:hypothetical protein